MKRFTSYFPMLLLFVVAALLSKCERYMDEWNEAPYDSSQPISFTAETDMATRGTPVNNAEDLTSMGVFCAATGLDDWSSTATANKMFNERLNNNSGTWTYHNSDIYWGATDITERYSFFAYTPYASTDNGITVTGSSSTQGKPTMTYTVPNDVTKQPDLMFAVPRYNIRPRGNKVALAMKHALTCVGFQIMGDGEKLTAISITGVSVSGDIVMDGSNIEWTNLGSPTSTDFSASINYDTEKDYFTLSTTMTNLLVSDGYLMMIPQELGSDAKIKLTFKDNTVKEISLDNFTWEAGKRITYAIGVTPKEPPPGGLGDILYFVGDELRVGKWSTDVNSTNIAYFKFGSVIGFLGTGQWQLSQIKFNTSGGDYAIYANVPYYGTGAADWDEGRRNVSEPSYHYGANVKAGKGDPCKLVGLSATQIRNMSAAQIEAYNSGWRMPTVKENVLFVGGHRAEAWQPGQAAYTYTQSTGSAADQYNYWVASGAAGNPTVPSGTRYGGVWLPVIKGASPNSDDGNFLPAAHFRDASGNIYSGIVAYYWSSEPRNNTDGDYLRYYNSALIPTAPLAYASGATVRCVPARFEISRSALSFAQSDVNAGAGKIIEVLTKLDWTYSLSGNNASDFTVVQSGNTLNVYPNSANTTTVLRTAILSITAAEITKTVNLRQGIHHILYFDGDVLRIGEWGFEVNSNNIAYFNFGSTIGFSGTTTWNVNLVKFNTSGGNYAAYTAIPRYNTGAADWDENRRNVSEPSYHYGANVKAGKGDPCKLVGLSATQIRNMSAADIEAYYSGWRLPTVKENVLFAGGSVALTWQQGQAEYTYTQSTGSAANQYNYYTSTTLNPAHLPMVLSGTRYGGIWFPVIQGANPNSAEGTFLPAAHYREAGGGFYSSVVAYYWSSEPRSNTAGDYLRYYNSALLPTASAAYAAGMTVRCVPTRFEVSKSALSFVQSDAGAGNSQIIEVLTKESWTYSISGKDASDFTVSQSGDRLTIYPNSTNNTAAPRTATISITAAGVTKTVNLRQGIHHILYIDGDVLRAGEWGAEVNSSNIAYFKFGSTIGFSGTTTWNANLVTFNTSGAGTYGTYGNIPSYVAADWNAGRKNVSETSGANAYHTGANVKAGKGDPCRLVGLSAAQIQGMSAADIEAYNSGWRLPTIKENALFVGGGQFNETQYNQGTATNQYNYWTTTSINPAHLPAVLSGTRYPGIWFPVIKGANPNSAEGNFLPAAYFRDANGGFYTGIVAYYWSSEPRDASNGDYLRYYSSALLPSSPAGYAAGMTVRCVRE